MDEEDCEQVDLEQCCTEQVKVHFQVEIRQRSGVKLVPGPEIV